MDHAATEIVRQGSRFKAGDIVYARLKVVGFHCGPGSLMHKWAIVQHIDKDGKPSMGPDVPAVHDMPERLLIEKQTAADEIKGVGGTA